MRFSPLLLRLLLILALIANGATSAFAATQMQVAHLSENAAEVKASKLARAESATPPCHEHASARQLSTVDDETSPGHISDSAGDTEHGSTDCCKSAKCVCACMQHVATTPATMHVLQASVDHASSGRPLKVGHTAPALPHLIRPPIS